MRKTGKTVHKYLSSDDDVTGGLKDQYKLQETRTAPGNV